MYFVQTSSMIRFQSKSIAALLKNQSTSLFSPLIIFALRILNDSKIRYNLLELVDDRLKNTLEFHLTLNLTFASIICCIELAELYQNSFAFLHLQI